MKTLIIAEKPSLAREIQAMLESEEGESFQKNPGYVESKKYYISWFFGHLLKAKKPDEINPIYKKWNLEHLPILEDMEFQYTTGEMGTDKQGQLLAKLAQDAALLINACDPDREGEGIFRIWYRFEGIDKPVKRFWSPSLALKDLYKSWGKMKSAEAYDNLGLAQAMRSYSDYAVGMNGTRAYTLRAGGEILPIGRVKTATLSLIVQRDHEVEGFIKSFSYKLVGDWQKLPFELLCAPEEQDALQKILNNIASESFSVSSSTKERKNTNPLKPFSMPDLQAEANRLFDYDLDVTLEIAQSLYEKKFITYPRTDSPYLPAADLDKYVDLFNKLASDEEKRLKNPRTPAFVKNTEDPHSAIIVTDITPAEGSLDEHHGKIYQLIKSRFVTSFLKPFTYDEVRVEISGTSGYTFRSIYKKPIDWGYKGIFKDEEDDGVNDYVDIDAESLGIISSPFSKLTVKEIEKKKPSYYTPATLLKAMINVSKGIEDKELKDVLRDVEGLGTAATRDQYPKDLEHDGYVFRKGKYIISNSKGRNLIKIVHPKLREAVFTAEFESDLRKIERGEMAANDYKAAIQDFVREIILIDDISSDFIEEEMKCPKCGGRVKAYEWGWGCSAGKERCGFTISKKICEKELTESIVKELLKNGHTKNAVKGFWSKKTNNQFSAWLKLSQDFKIEFAFESLEIGVVLACPKCGKPIKEFGWGWACSAGKDVCGFTISGKIAEKKISYSNVKDLIINKRTKEIKGFKSQSGKEFSAALVFDGSHRIKFEFINK